MGTCLTISSLTIRNASLAKRRIVSQVRAMAFSYSKLRNAEKYLLAHGLNNDLTAILGRCALLNDLVSHNSEAAKHLRIIRALAHHMVDRVAEHPSPATETGNGDGVGDLVEVSYPTVALCDDLQLAARATIGSAANDAIDDWGLGRSSSAGSATAGASSLIDRPSRSRRLMLATVAKAREAL